MNVIGETEEDDVVITMNEHKRQGISPPKEKQPQKQQKTNSSSTSSSGRSGIDILKLRGVSNCFDHDEELHPSEEFTANAAAIEKSFAREMAEARDLAEELGRMRMQRMLAAAAAAAAMPATTYSARRAEPEPLPMPEEKDFGVNQLISGDPQYDLVHRKFIEGMAGTQVKNVKIYEVEATARAKAAFEASLHRISARKEDYRLLWHGTTQLTTCQFGKPGEDLAGPCSGGMSTDQRCNVCSIIRVSFQQGKSRFGGMYGYDGMKNNIFFSPRSGYRFDPIILNIYALNVDCHGYTGTNVIGQHPAQHCMFLATVCCGKMQPPGNVHQTVPAGYNSAIDRSKMEIVISDPTQAYPSYLVIYQTKPPVLPSGIGAGIGGLMGYGVGALRGQADGDDDDDGIYQEYNPWEHY